MNFFESELKKIMGNSNILKDQKYVGVCVMEPLVGI